MRERDQNSNQEGEREKWTMDIETRILKLVNAQSQGCSGEWRIGKKGK